MSRDPLAEALDALRRCGELPVPAALAPGPHGEAILARFHRAAFEQCADAARLVHFATENNGLVIYRRVDDPRTAPVISGYVNWLESNGTPLSGFPADFAETPLASPAVRSHVQGRTVSASFLWHLCLHARLSGLLTPRRVIEIGGGFGGLARLNALAWPDCHQVLVDLPETLVFAYAYLRLTLPTHRVVFATSAADLDSACDILLVPTALLYALDGQSFDLAINVASFGEMTESAVAAYHDLLQNRLLVAHFYSINQFGAFADHQAGGRGRRLDGVTRSSLQLDKGWDIRLWDMHGACGFAQIDPLAAPSLEVFLRRNQMTEGELQQAAEDLVRQADGFAEGSSDWHRCMWQAAMKWPQGQHKARYETYCRHLGWREFAN